MRKTKGPSGRTGQGEELPGRGFVPHVNNSIAKRGCQLSRHIRPMADVIAPMLLVSVLSDLPAVSGGLVALARRWQGREVGSE